METPAEVAPEPAKEGDGEVAAKAGDEQKPDENEQQPALDEHRAEPVKCESETVEQKNARIRKLWRERAWEKQAASDDAKAHSDEVKRIEGEIDKLIKETEELDLEEVINHDRKIVEYKSKSTGLVVRTRPMVAADRQEKLPFDKSKQAPPDEPAPQKKETFSDLRDGKVWEHDQYGCVRILAVLDDSVRVQTDALDEPAEGIEIGRADWDANEAHPREVPELAVGQRWAVGGQECIIAALDDRAVCYDAPTDEGRSVVSGRRSRMQFCSADAKRLDATVIVPGTIELGQHYRLMDEGIADGNRLVTVTSVGDTVIEVRWAHSGLGGSVPREYFAFAELATQEEIDAALVQPKRKGKKNVKAQPEAAE